MRRNLTSTKTHCLWVMFIFVCHEMLRYAKCPILLTLAHTYSYFYIPPCRGEKEKWKSHFMIFLPLKRIHQCLFGRRKNVRSHNLDICCKNTRWCFFLAKSCVETLKGLSSSYNIFSTIFWINFYVSFLSI